MVTAGLAAQQIDQASAPASADHGTTCANCGAALAGSFCHACGQRSHLHRSLAHLGEEFLHGILHFDAKAWRTLPLLVAKPGELTRRYIDGQRTRFVSPLALFLFLIFFLFFIGSYFGKGTVDTGQAEGVKEARVAIAADSDKARATLASAEAALADASKRGADTSTLALEVEEARAEIADLTTAARVVAVAGDAQEIAKGPGSRDQPWEKVRSDIDFIDTAVDHATKNPELTLYKLKNTGYKFSFLLVPISLPFLWLMFFWRRGVTMYDHAVFSLYSLSFMALLFALLFLLKFAGLSWSVVGKMLFFVPPVHMFLQLRGTYGLSWGSTLWRTVALQSIAATVFGLYLALILYLSM